MKRTANALKSAHRIQPELTFALFSSLLLPLLIMAVFGGIYIFREGYGLYFAGLLAASSLLTVIPVLWGKRQQQDVESQTVESLVQPSGDWGEFDQQVWDQVDQNIPELLEDNDEWDQLKEHGLTIISRVAALYGRKELAFSLPELLKLTEEVSRRYRKILLEHTPFIEKIPFSLYRYGYQHQEQARKGLKISSWLFNIYRAARLTTPAGIVSEIRSRILGETFGSLNDRLQHQLKQALLQEVLSVSIELYSGRFNLDDEVFAHASEVADLEQLPVNLEPLKVCLVGQTGAGKSSIINALKNEVVAEASVLPSTDQVRVYEYSVEDMEALRLIDLPGFDGNAETEKLLLEQVSQSHVILWVLKANQPARTLDLSFKSQLDAFYQRPENRSRKRPVIIGVLNQVDRLKQAAHIDEALQYNQELLSGMDIIPLSAGGSETLNVSVLEQRLDHYFDEGIQVQLNQKRIDGKQTIHPGQQAKRIFQSGKSLFTLLKKKPQVGRSAANPNQRSNHLG